MLMRIIVFLLLLFFSVAARNVELYGASFETDMHLAVQNSNTRPAAEQPQSAEVINEPNDVLTLRQTLTLALLHNPELKVFSLEMRAAQARELQAGLWPNPELEVEIENVGGTGNLNGFNGAETTIWLGQLIELGDKSQKRKKVASLQKELADWDYERKRLEIFSEATKAFIAVLETQQKLQLSGDLLNLSRESFNAVQKRVDAGKDSPLEKTRAGVAVSNIEIQFQKAQRDLEFARKRLTSFWVQEIPRFQKAVGQLEELEPPLSQQHLIELLRRNPEYARWETELKKNKAVLELEKSKSLPDITFAAGLRRFNATDDNAFVFGVGIPLPVSDRNQGTRQEAIINLSKAGEEQKAAWLKLQNEFNQKYQEFINAYSLATSLKNQVLPAATELFNAARRAYQEGKSDYLNVLDAQRTFFELKNEYIQSLAAYHSAGTDIERLIAQQITLLSNTSGKE